MGAWLSSWFGQNGFLPHGYCFTWSPGVLWSMVGADAVIAASYYSIPLVLVQISRRRPDMQFNWVLLLFSAFIFGCGTTHLMAIWVVWQPDYALEALAKVITAGISVVTAIALWPLLPKIISQPSTAQLRAAIDKLEAEVRQRRSAEDNLIEVEQTLAATLASIGAGFVATDREGRIVRLNEVAEHITGWTQREAMGRSYWEVVERENRPPGYRARSPIDVLIGLGTAPSEATHVTMVARDGRRTRVDVRASLFRGADGSTVRGMAVVMRDLTDEMRAQSESSKLAAIVASSHDAIIGATLDGHITSWNDAAQSMLGYRADEIVGHPVHELLPADQVEQERRLFEALARGEVVPPFDTVRRTKAGALLEVSVTASPVLDARGRIVGASKIVRDISAKRRAEESRSRALALQAENRQIQEASRLKSEFLANMSHELRTPLNAIIGFADLMHAGKVPVDSPKHKLFIEHIRASGRHLLQLINDILDLSKVEAGKFEFDPEPVLLPEVAADVLNVLNEQATSKSLEIGFELDPAVEHLVIDARRLKQVLYNYLSNALKFTPAGGRVTVRAKPVDERLWRLEVEDTGIGIPADQIGRLFTEFQQLDSGQSKAHAGTGLGLALTRRLVEAQGGTVGVHSTPGLGSTFHAVLPRDALRGADGPAGAGGDASAGAHAGAGAGAGAAATAEVTSTGASSPSTPLAAGPSVLIIEDDVRDGRLLTEALATAGFDVAWATTAEQALALTRERTFAAITLDLVLPDMPGLQLLAELRARGPNRDTPVLVVTLLGNPLPLQAYAVADVLAKPVNGGAVVAALMRNGVDAPRRHGRQLVMVVDDDAQARALMSTALESAGYHVAGYAGAGPALEALRGRAAGARPAAAIIDLSMPGLDGFALLDRLHEMPEARGLPIFVWTSRELDARDRRRLRERADAVLSKATPIEQLLEHVRARLKPQTAGDSDE